MRCDFPLMPVVNSINAVRRELDRQAGCNTDQQHGLAIFETDDAFEIQLDVPGVRMSDLEITVHDGVLNIQASRNLDLPEGATARLNRHRSESVEKSIRLDDGGEPDSVDAVLDHGVLQITMKRRPELQPRRVSVRTA